MPICCALLYHMPVGYYQVHHHVHRADFVWVHFVKILLHLLKRGPRGDIMIPALLDKLFKCSREYINTHCLKCLNSHGFDT